MYNIQYPAVGQTEIANEICALFSRSNLPYQPVLGRGLDHGVWVPLLHMYPEANIPVIAVSVDSLRSPQEQYDIGRMLEQLRHDHVLIIGSGGTVHNLRMLAQDDEPQDWAIEFDDWLGERLQQWNTRELFQYDKKLLMHGQQYPPMEWSISHLCSMRWAQRICPAQPGGYFNPILMARLV